MFLRVVSVLSLGLSFCVPARAQFLDGIDVSHWQGTIDWNQVKNDGIDFAFVKATEGVDFIDPRYQQNMQGAIAAGVHTGPYHFTRIDSFNGVPFTSYDGSPFLPGSDPYVDAVGEANDFLDAITPYYNTGLHLPPVADVEGLPDFGDQSLERTFISNWMQLFSDTVSDALGVRPLIYTSKFGANNRYTPEVAAQHDLWLAWWKGTGTSDPPVQSDTPLFDRWQFWQYTSTGSVAGISGNVDRNVFEGTLTDLESLLIGNDGPVQPWPVTTITDFELDEGYFGWSTSYSGSNQGIGAGSTAQRVTTEAHRGAGSQEISIDAESGSWVYRHVSGIGSPAANPASNLLLETEGSVGFWLKTNDPGIEVQLGVDEPSPNIDRGVAKQVIADGQWHLYEWELGDDAQWEPWTGGADGQITGPTFSLDSIRFTGTGDATFYLDTVAHNPDGSLSILEGDYDADADTDLGDLLRWQRNDASPQGLQAWHDFMSGGGSSAAAVVAPEPGVLSLLAIGLLALARLRER